MNFRDFTFCQRLNLHSEEFQALIERGDIGLTTREPATRFARLQATSAPRSSCRDGCMATYATSGRSVVHAAFSRSTPRELTFHSGHSSGADQTAVTDEPYSTQLAGSRICPNSLVVSAFVRVKLAALPVKSPSARAVLTLLDP